MSKAKRNKKNVTVPARRAKYEGYINYAARRFRWKMTEEEEMLSAILNERGTD